MTKFVKIEMLVMAEGDESSRFCRGLPNNQSYVTSELEVIFETAWNVLISPSNHQNTP